MAMADDRRKSNKKDFSLAYPKDITSWNEKPIPGLTITTAFAIWLFITTAVIPALVQRFYYASGFSSSSISLFPPINVLGWSILFFNNLNVLIAFCEIALGNHIDFIKKHYQHLKKEYRDDKTFKPKKAEYLAGFAYLNMSLSLRDLYDGGQKWARMWSTYSLWDPSYSNPESFGFFIDVGNGWSTLLPCWLWNFAILFPHYFAPSNETGRTDSSALVLLGFIGACSYWQILYGTIIYFLSFLWNKRFQNKPLLEVVGFVGFANGIWFFFPIACLWASYKLLLYRDPQSVFWS
mmetsp:Transcript_15195/g.35209  ORF Transcript_15195/g.35209 Transcript_15195/m.35209 type:complete len:293 (-) Transcript_15195:229-1107(-)|eukprot:CAMPEP_0197185946 /NCGR_PEP_ID=MMETSP1423-20130617/12926_1 /TAXON_ID=476441 /ORGANISM="Pseudo-nitzschia heimii, Strain UNC1101" /LENGTH=292 /DNA_ID=CAMNT_0042637127 /DNA_START=109 /DNA_END=987 /DNA_ORIENTATION=-